MSESLQLIDYITLAPSHHDRATRYIADCMNSDDLWRAYNITKEFSDPDRPMASTAVLIPVAAAQESGRIGHSLAEYGKQTTDEPFTVFLLLNCPTDQMDSKPVADTYQQIANFKRLYPHLDVRTSLMGVENETIGGLRRDLWNSVLLLAHSEGTFTKTGQDVIGISHDIDTVYMSPRYIERVQKAYDANVDNLAHPTQIGLSNVLLGRRGSRVKHAYPSNYPNISRVLKWVDATYSLSDPSLAPYEEGMVLPLSWYAHRGGFNSNHATHETRTMSTAGGTKVIPGTVLETSPRRYIERLQEHPVSEVWTTDSFTIADECRTTLPKSDISLERATELIGEQLADDITNLWDKRAYNGANPVIERLALSDDKFTYEATKADLQENVTRAARRQMRVIDRILRSVVQIDALADKVAADYPVEEITKQVVDQLLKELVEEDLILPEVPEASSVAVLQD